MESITLNQFSKLVASKTRLWGWWKILQSAKTNAHENGKLADHFSCKMAAGFFMIRNVSKVAKPKAPHIMYEKT